MKKLMLLLIVLCLLLAGCAKENTAANAGATENNTANSAAQNNVPAEDSTPVEDSAPEEESAPAITVMPLPDTTMENLTDAILSVSLEEGDAYVDDTGKLQMDVTVYTYDKYDLVDISMLKVGDTIVTHAGEVEVTALEQTEGGLILINGGQEEGGFDLFTDDSGVYFELGFNDVRNWYEVGTATLRVSVDFEGRDCSDPEAGEVIFYPGSFLNGEIANYDFTPFNTTIRVEEGQVVEMTRAFIP